MQVSIQTENLVKRFGDFTAIDRINLKIKKGEIYCLLGPNGAGKTTTIRVICGLLGITEGDVLVNDVSIRDHPIKVKSFLGYMPQYHCLYEDLTVVENIRFYAKMFLMKEGLSERIREILDFVDLWEFRGQLLGNLSGGMKQRASLACAMVHNPDIFILDEPTAGVDPVLRRSFWDYFKYLKKTGKTIFVTTHYMDEAENADWIDMMRDGKVIVSGDPAHIRRQLMKESMIKLTVSSVSNQILTKLRELKTVESVDTLGRDIHIYTEDLEVCMRELIYWIAGEGLDVSSMSVSEPSLEDTFVHYARGEDGS